MNLNQFTYHKANPFYKQDFIPDRAWYNRKVKEFPSELPSGQEFFPQSGRKHFLNKFNSSQIQHDSVLKSPQRYPFQNRIALDKSYMRSLNTIDIEGASSNTRINQSIKNKYKARDQLIRRYNQSVEIRKPELTQQQKRRQLAIHIYQQSKAKPQKSYNNQIGSSHLMTNNPQINKTPATLKKDLTEEYKRFVMHNSSNKYHKDIPQANYIQQSRLNTYNQLPQHRNNSYSTIQPDNLSRPKQYIYNNSLENNPNQTQKGNRFQRQINHNSQPSSHYNNQYNAQKLRNSEQYRKIIQYEQSKKYGSYKNNDYRKNTPTNLSLSFNLAGQSIVSN